MIRSRLQTSGFGLREFSNEQGPEQVEGISPRLKKVDQEPLVHRYDDLIRSVQKLLTVLRNPKPGA